MQVGGQVYAHYYAMSITTFYVHGDLRLPWTSIAYRGGNIIGTFKECPYKTCALYPLAGAVLQPELGQGDTGMVQFGVSLCLIRYRTLFTGGSERRRGGDFVADRHRKEQRAISARLQQSDCDNPLRWLAQLAS